MLLLDEVFAERDEQQDAQDSSDEGTEEYLGEIDCQFRVFVLQDVQGREGEDGSCHDDSRAGSDRLDDDVLPQGILALECAGESYRYYRYRYGGLEDLPYFQSQECCGSREDDGHHEADGHGPGCNLGIDFLRAEERLVLLAGFQLPECVFGECYFFIFFAHKNYVLGRFGFKTTNLIGDFDIVSSFQQKSVAVFMEWPVAVVDGNSVVLENQAVNRLGI